MTMEGGWFYDTHAAIRRLTKAGIPEPHAEAIAYEFDRVIEHRLATKADIEKPGLTTKADIEKPGLATKADIEKPCLTTKVDIGSARVELEKLEREQTLWKIGYFVVMGALVIAAITL